jgi:hypothetical protein
MRTSSHRFSRVGERPSVHCFASAIALPATGLSAGGGRRAATAAA